MRFLPLMFAFTALPALAGLPDTGQTLCDSGYDAWVPCSAANTGDGALRPRQDGRYGQDAQAGANALTKTGDGVAGFDYTALDSGGNPTSPGAGATPHSCVRDNDTGLVWEVKTDDGGLHDRDWTFSWYDSNPATNGGVAGTSGGGSCGGTVAGGCDTEHFAAAVNAAGWCGCNTWRLPSARELLTLVNVAATPVVDATYFPNTPAVDDKVMYWTSTTHAQTPANAWRVFFARGSLTDGDKSSANLIFARLVCGTAF